MWWTFVAIFIFNINYGHLRYNKHVDNNYDYNYDYDYDYDYDHNYDHNQEHNSSLEMEPTIVDNGVDVLGNFTSTYQDYNPEYNLTTEENSAKHEDVGKFYLILFAFCFIILGGVCALARGGFSG